MLTQDRDGRLDPETLEVSIDEHHYQGSRGSSSRAKKLDATNRIWFARLSSRFSCSSALIRAASLVDTPGRLPASISACLHQPIGDVAAKRPCGHLTILNPTPAAGNAPRGGRNTWSRRTSDTKVSSTRARDGLL